MKIFKEDFYNLFRKKHGEEIFSNIKKQIINESKESVNDKYISMIFDVAYAKFIGVSEEKINHFIQEFFGTEIIGLDIQKIIEKHEESIKKIIQYIECSIPKIN